MGDLGILVVDDDDAVLRACHRVLAVQARSYVANRRVEALEIARRQALDAAVVDYLLGDENGIELIKELKSLHVRRVLVWSGYASTEVTVAAMQAGADDVRSKPVAPSALLRWLVTNNWRTNSPVFDTATLDRVQWDYVHRVVNECDGNLSEAARRLGIERATLRRHMRRPAPSR